MAIWFSDPTLIINSGPTKGEAMIDLDYYKTVVETQRLPSILLSELKDLISEIEKERGDTPKVSPSAECDGSAKMVKAELVYSNSVRIDCYQCSKCHHETYMDQGDKPTFCQNCSGKFGHGS